jgi:SAM-dependent methyltransferase
MHRVIDNPFTDDNIAEVYKRHSCNYHRYQKAFEALTKLVPLESRILEIGVGNGAFTELLLSFGYDVKGIDRSEEMLKKAPEQIQALSQHCDLLDYEPSQRYEVIVSHSGGFTFKRGKFETYYQREKDLEKALEKIQNILSNGGGLLVNKGEHDDKIDLGDGAILSVELEENDKFRIYNYTFEQGNQKMTKQQKRLVYSPKELQAISSQYFKWNFENELWIIGEKL